MDKPPLDVNISLADFYDSALEGQDELENISIVDELASIDIRYHDEGIIASGGMKDILKTQDRMTGRTVAKGVLRQEKSDESLEKFIDEVRITASLEHPNIIPVYDIGLTSENSPYFTMKLIDGEDLQVILDRLNAKDADALSYYNQDRMLEIFLKVCDAIEYAHSKNILHLDIKPANIQIGEFGEVLVCDWGLARNLKTSKLTQETLKPSEEIGIGLTLDGHIKGSPGFMAPEQISSDIAPRSVRTDIYGLGCLLYNLLTLKQPVEGDNLSEVLKKTYTGDLLEISTRNSEVKIAPALCAVITKALSLLPKDRYSCVKELSDEIRSYKNGFATQAENAGVLQQFFLLTKRNKTIFSFIVLCFLMSLFFLIKINNEKKAVITLNSGLIEEKKKVIEANKEAASFLLNSSKDKYFQSNFEQAYSGAKQAYKLDPHNEAIHSFLAYFYLGELKPEKAAIFIDKLKASKTTEKNTWLFECGDYLSSLEKEGEIAVENVILFRDYLRDFHFKSKLKLSHHVNYSVTRRYNLKDRVKFAEVYLTEHSKSPIKINTQNDVWSLSLGQKAYTIWKIAVLEKLPLKYLNISNSRVKTLESLEGMPLEELNIANTPINELKGLEKLNLKRINISDSGITTFTSMPQSIEEIEIGEGKMDYKKLITLVNLKTLIIPDVKDIEQAIMRLKPKFKVVLKK